MQPNRDFWSNRCVCVLGGTGFLGYHLSRQLYDLGAQVRVFGLPPSDQHPLRNDRDLDVRYGDVLNLKQVREDVSGCSVVFNAAGVVTAGAKDKAKFRAIHVDAVRNALTSADSHTRIVHTSSVTAVGGSRRPLALTEESPFKLDRVRIDYVHAKRAAEQAALAAAVERDVLVVNPGYLIGPNDTDLSIMGWLCRHFWRGRLSFAPRGGLNLVDVRDVATGHLLAAEHGRAGRRYILGGENITQRDFLWRLADVAGWRPRFIPRLPSLVVMAYAAMEELHGNLRGKRAFPSFHDGRVGALFWYYRSDRARTELGFRARPLRESLEDTYAWHMAHALRPLRGVPKWWFRAG